MPAPDADVLAVPVSLVEQLVGVDAKEAREGVAHAGDGAALKNRLAAAGAPVPVLEERAVVHAVAEQPAPQTVERAGGRGGLEIQNGSVSHIP